METSLKSGPSETPKARKSKTFRDEIKRLRFKMDVLNKEKIANRKKIKDLRTENIHLRGRVERGIRSHKQDWDKRPRRKTTWQQDVRNIIRKGGTMEQAIKRVNKKACTAGNMSCVVFHPGLKFKAGPKYPLPGGARAEMPKKPFDFLRLPPLIQAKIFKIWLVKDSSIHCISRIDPHGMTGINRASQDGFPRVFHWDAEECSIRDARKPNEVLSILSVSKAFYHIGASCFYSLNTFAFSSLGELGRFLRGIGHARRQRIQSFSLTWIGAKMPKESAHSVRTRPLHDLPQMRRLTYIDIHLDESHWRRERRKYEERHVKNILLNSTWNQYNMRSLRALQTIQGIDYVHQLRGIKMVNVFDYNRDGIKAIRNRHFLHDLRSQIYLPKKAKDERRARWDNLDPFIRNWDIPKYVHEITRFFFEQNPAGRPERFSRYLNQVSVVPRISEDPDAMDDDPESDEEESYFGNQEDKQDNFTVVGGTRIKTDDIVDLTNEAADEGIVQSIEHDVDSVSHYFPRFDAVIKDENINETNFRGRSSTSGMFMTPTPSFDPHMFVPRLCLPPEEHTFPRLRLLERKLGYTGWNQRRLRVQGTAPL